MALATPDRVITPDAHLRQTLFSDAVMQHPAKQHLPQLIHLLSRFAVPGGVLLDPFGGSGSAMLACSPAYGRGMHVVTVELAPHFLALQQTAWAHFRSTIDMFDAYDVPPGEYVPVYGNSRDLPSVLTRMAEDEHGYWDGADLIVTSPSYGGSEAVDQRNKQNTTIAAHGGGNTAKLRYDAAEMARNGDVPTNYGHMRKSGGVKGKTHLPAYQPPADLVVTSPPYMDTLNGEHAGRDGYGNHHRATAAQSIDIVVTSPPYADALSKTSGIDADKIKSIHSDKSQAVIASRYDTNAENIGNQRGKKYLSSMKQVWAGCYWALKPGGILCCITRDCVRDGKIVPVGEQNRYLLEAVGFQFVECEQWRLTQMSFWRTLQKRKKPDSPVIDSEQVWIMQKPHAFPFRASGALPEMEGE